MANEKVDVVIVGAGAAAHHYRDVFHRELGIVVEGGGDPAGLGIGLDPAGELDDGAALGVVDDEVEGSDFGGPGDRDADRHQRRIERARRCIELQDRRAVGDRLAVEQGGGDVFPACGAAGRHRPA